MNKERRSTLKRNNSRIDIIIEQLNIYKAEVDRVLNEESDAFDNLPESFQDGIRGQDMQDAIDEMEEAEEDIDEIIEKLMEIKNNLNIL